MWKVDIGSENLLVTKHRKMMFIIYEWQLFFVE